MTRSGRPYELFVREIHQAFLSQSDIKNIDVRHDVKIIGKSGASHQVDVYWEFEVGGHRYRTCVECKSLSSNVKKSQVLTFAALLQDVAPATGIFVTTVGYQDGAKKIAEQHGIRLLTLNPIIREVETTMNVTVPTFIVHQVRFDEGGVKELMRQAGLTIYNYDLEVHRETPLLTEAGEDAGLSFNDALRPVLREDGHYVVPFKGYCIASEIGPLPLLEVACERVSTMLTDKFTVKVGSDAVTAILEDVLANTREYVNEDGTREPPQAT